MQYILQIYRKLCYYLKFLLTSTLYISFLKKVNKNPKPLKPNRKSDSDDLCKA
jgi:hypothetical protein